MNYRRLIVVFVLLLLLIAFPVIWTLYRSAVDGQLVDSTELELKQRVIYSTAEENGQANYVEMLNREFFDQVPIEKNFLVTVLETNPTGLIPGLDFELVEEYRKRFKFRQPAPFPLKTWGVEQKLAVRFPDLQFSKNDCLLFVQKGCRPEYMNPQRERVLDALLELQSPALDEIISQLNQCPLFAVPFIDNREMLDNSFDNAQGLMLNMAKWLNVRAGARLLRGKLEWAWLDTRAMLQLADRAAQGPTAQDPELSLMIWRMAYTHFFGAGVARLSDVFSFARLSRLNFAFQRFDFNFQRYRHQPICITINF